MFKVFGITGISEIEFFNFSSTEKFKTNYILYKIDVYIVKITKMLNIDKKLTRIT